MARVLLTTLLVLALGAAPGPAAADLFVPVDAGGTVHIARFPPSGDRHGHDLLYDAAAERFAITHALPAGAAARIAATARALARAADAGTLSAAPPPGRMLCLLGDRVPPRRSPFYGRAGNRVVTVANALRLARGEAPGGHPPVKISQSTFTHLECGHRPSQALNSADRISAPVN